jgi:hypothetical protein
MILREPVSRRLGNSMFSIFAIHLCAGNNLVHRAIKTNTVRQYLKAASRFIVAARFSEIDFRYADATLHCDITSVLAAHRRWGQIPNRREPFTPKMLLKLERANREANSHFWAKDSALADWFAVRLFTGIRLSEWAQDSSAP